MIVEPITPIAVATAKTSKMEQPVDNKAKYIKWAILAIMVITGVIFLLPLFKTRVAPAIFSSTEGGGEATDEPTTINPNKLDVKNGLVDNLSLGDKIGKLRLKPVSEEAIAERKKSNDPVWNAYEAQQNLGGYNAFWGRVQELYGKGSDDTYKKSENEAYVSGFLKGMNLQQSVAMVNKWLPFLNEYMSSTTKQFHYNISSQGAFLK